jgi:phage recombination protein Bet
MSQSLIQFNPDQMRLIRETVARGTSPDQFALFIEVCRLSGLNPFARQIYAVVRGGQLSIQTSIDGYRLLAERSGKYAGQLGPQWCGEDGVWLDVWLSDKPPAAARVGVLRKDFQQPVWGVAKYKSYAQTSNLWQKMPDTMLAKCSESLALRRAFPAEMSGIYTREEMEQADGDPLPSMPVPVAPSEQVIESDPAPHVPSVADLKALCDEVVGPGKWGSVRGRFVDPAQFGDVPDEMLSDKQLADIHAALLARQKARAKAGTAGGGR